MNADPIMITGHDVLGVILRRNREREETERRARRLGFSTARRKTRVARMSPSETIESNLPLPRK
ncbi:MAG: hypothetical protein M3Y03_04790 [Verrucomicrobiota bacterium]|nr:hypothetical protein [Verrucomicrobiota bacterium]